MQVPVINMAGETVSEIELMDQVFGIEPNVAVMHQALVRQMANARLGTHKTKTRSEVAGGGRKPWAQKGTGHARQGSRIAPHWRGGGIVGGPTPRSYAQKMNRKMRRLALRSALSSKAADAQILVVDSLEMAEPRTKGLVDVLAKMNISASVLMLLPEQNANLELSARNLPHVKTARANCLSVRDLLGHDYVMITRAAVDVIHNMLGAG
jgi:large subunit ribosomal protein L4